MNILTCTDVSITYKGRAVAQSINFEVNKGDYLCIVGENGSGKSTLMKYILGLMPVETGRITFDSDFHRTEIGYLPQQTSIQKDFPATVKEVIMSGRLNQHKFWPFYTKEDIKIVNETIDKLNIKELEHRCFRELSGGQKQRVLLGRALCASSSLLVLDEPVAGLDPAAMNSMYTLIDELNREQGMTVIMVSHDVSSVNRYATHILHLGPTPLFFGKKEDYLKSDACCEKPRKGGDVYVG